MRHANFAPHLYMQSYKRILEHHQWATLPLIVSGRFAFYLPQQAGFPLIGLPVTGPGPLLDR
jgi:hypothetical protein